MNNLYALLAYPMIALSVAYAQTICLTVPVKDDEEVIERCLESAKQVADCVLIYDLGSKDRTLEIAEQFLLKTNLPGKVFTPSEKNSGPFQAAQQMLEEFGCFLDKSYLLLLHPDMVLSTHSNIKKELLDEKAYLILEKSHLLSYFHYVPNLLNAALPWEGVGALKQIYATPKLESITIDDMPGEKRKTNRLKQMIEELQLALKSDPNNQQLLFPLAHHYKALKSYDEAIKAYTMRTSSEENREEAWFSKYMLGECYEEIGQWDHALYWYLEAFQYDASRAEPLRKIATYYRLRGQNDLAYMFAKHGSRIPPSQNQNLFPMSPLESYQFDEELSIAAYYTRFREEGLEAANALILARNIPWYIKTQTYQNLLYYVQNLEETSFYPIQPELPLIEQGFDERYHPMNPSIQKTEDGYALICRAVNYTQKGAKTFHTIDLKGMFRTKNFLIDYDEQFNLRSQKEIVEALDRERFPAWSIEGFEDCRLFSMDKRFWFTCTSCDTNPTGQRQISLCQLSKQHSGSLLDTVKLTPLKGPDPNRCEKNWLPFVKDGELLMVYSYDPFIIYKPDRETGDCRTVVHYEPTRDFSNMRGSAGPILFDDGYLLLVHEVVLLPNQERVYLHRFLYLDDYFVIKKASKPFTFRHQGIEYCCSMTIDHSREKLILPIGIEDREAFLCSVSIEHIRTLLTPL